MRGSAAGLPLTKPSDAGSPRMGHGAVRSRSGRACRRRRPCPRRRRGRRTARRTAPACARTPWPCRATAPRAASASSRRRPRRAPARTPAHNPATVASTSSAGTAWVTNPTSRANEASNGSPVRNAAASRDPLARRRIGTEMIAAATPMRTSVRANVIASSTTTRSHDAINPMPPARAGPFTAAIVGTSASIRRVSTRDERPRVGRPVAPLLEVGAGAERRRRVGQHDRPCRPVGDRRLGRIEGDDEVGHQPGGQGVAVPRGVEGDGRHAIRHGEADDWLLPGHAAERTYSAADAAISARNSSTTVRSLVRRIGGRARMTSQR